MTDEFRELTSRLARAKNFDGGAYILITLHPDEKDIKVDMKGSGYILLTGLIGALSSLLDDADVKTQQDTCEALVKLVSDNQTKRFQNTEMECAT